MNKKIRNRYDLAAIRGVILSLEKKIKMLKKQACKLHGPDRLLKKEEARKVATELRPYLLAYSFFRGKTYSSVETNMPLKNYSKHYNLNEIVKKLYLISLCMVPYDLNSINVLDFTAIDQWIRGAK